MSTVSEFEFEKLLEELETLRASSAIKQANIELLETENERLKTELLCLTYDRDALLAEREAMMKQEPVAYKVNDTKNKSEWITTIQNPEKYKRDYPDFILTPIYASPLPAQQIEQKLGSWHTYLPIITDDIVDIIGTDPVVLIESTTSTKSGYTWTQDAVDFCALIPVNEPAQQIPEGYALVEKSVNKHILKAASQISLEKKGYWIGNSEAKYIYELIVQLSASQPKGDV